MWENRIFNLNGEKFDDCNFLSLDNVCTFVKEKRKHDALVCALFMMVLLYMYRYVYHIYTVGLTCTRGKCFFYKIYNVFIKTKI